MERGLPQLSTAGWLSVLLAALATLVLGFYPVVVYPTVARRAPVSAFAMVLRSPVLALIFGAMTVALLGIALGGTRPPQQRNRAALAALATAVIGVAMLIAGIYSGVA